MWEIKLKIRKVVQLRQSRLRVFLKLRQFLVESFNYASHVCRSCILAIDRPSVNETSQLKCWLMDLFVVRSSVFNHLARILTLSIHFVSIAPNSHWDMASLWCRSHFLVDFDGIFRENFFGGCLANKSLTLVGLFTKNVCFRGGEN